MPLLFAKVHVKLQESCVCYVLVCVATVTFFLSFGIAKCSNKAKPF